MPPRAPALPAALRQRTVVIVSVGARRVAYGEEVVELVGVPVLSWCAADADSQLRADAAIAIADLAKSTFTDVCTDLIDLLEKVPRVPNEFVDSSFLKTPLGDEIRRVDDAKPVNGGRSCCRS